MSNKNQVTVEFSRFEMSQKLAFLLLQHKNLSGYTPEKLAEEFVEIVSKIDKIISDANFL